MASRQNPYYGQDIGSAIGSLADVFKPPSGADAYGYTKAASERQQMGIQQKLEAIANDPTLTTLQKQDALGIAANFFNPSQSNRSVDIDSQTKLATNAADNRQRFASTRYGDIAEGATRPALPASVADMYRMPEAPAATGVVKLGNGDTAFAPDGTVRRGQVTAKPGDVIMPPVFGQQQTQSAPGPATAMLPPAAPTSIAPASVSTRTGVPIIDAIMGAGGAPARVATPGIQAAPDTAAQPAQITPPTPQPEQPYGASSIVRGGPAPEKNGMTITTNPDGTTTVSYGGNGKLTEKQHAARLTANEMDISLPRIEQAIDGGYFQSEDYLGDYYKSLGTTKLTAPMLVPTMSKTGQQIRTDLEDQTTLYLYFKSGAARTPTEDEVQKAIIVPVPGEDPDVQRNKINTIRQRSEFIRQESGKVKGTAAAPAASAPASPLPPSGVTKPSPSQIDKLKANPDRAAEFDAKFGAGASSMYLGGAR